MPRAPQSGSPMKQLLCALAVLLGGSLTPAHATSYQDLWWNSLESGWGINVLHQGDTLVATWFIYDTGGKPMWLLGVLDKAGATSYAGAVYRYTGPGYNLVAFDPKQVTETAVGTAQFNFADPTHGSLTYTVNGTVVTKNVTRQTYAEPKANGTFVVAAYRVCSGCADPSQNSSYFVYGRAYDFFQAQDELSVGYGTLDSSNLFTMSCSAIGPFAVGGSIAGFSAPFRCANGTAGTLTISDLTTTDAGILAEAVWQFNAASGGCRYVESMSGARLQAVGL
jgi:hypothetical protein